ncbi:MULTISPECIES: nucleotide exchange factor GrpE [Limnospira]|uniref:nucleotide exchange factor GrpE n=1 Tax=Limnospira TaxID=2596745 RepID=UPI0014491877|nr:nucleotide exchange factor GrpE [Limnospira sp. PMC 894.15]MDT9187628.1 nucleotide exchange factor GrpE [Limnospira sp. PMC 894.15]QJB27624.1 nucleotide exchange factor GrpE [Limnospira fusiformis SAG 85.79]
MNDNQLSEPQQTTIEENTTSPPSDEKSANFNLADVIFHFFRGILEFLRSCFYNFWGIQGMGKTKEKSIVITEKQQSILNKIVSQQFSPELVLGVIIIRELAKGKQEQQVADDLGIKIKTVRQWAGKWLKATEELSLDDPSVDDDRLTQLIEKVFGSFQLPSETESSPVLPSAWETQIQTLNDRLINLESQLQTTNQSVTSVESQFPQVLNQLQGLENQLFPVIPQLTERVMGLESQLQATNESVTGLESQLQATNESVTGLESQLQATNESVKGLESQLPEVINQLQRLEDEMFPPLPPAIAKLVEDVCQKDEVSLAQDQQDIEDYYKQAQHWSNLNATLNHELKSAIENWESNLLPDCRKLKEQLPENIQERLKPRHEVIEMINRSLLRLRDVVDGLMANELPAKPQLPAITQQQLRNIVDGDLDPDAASQAIETELNHVQRERYQQIRAIQDVAETNQKNFTNFVKNKVLAILDNLDEGERYSKPIVKELVEETRQHQEILEQWLGFHGILRANLLDLLTPLGISTMKIEIGSPIDWNRHEPLDKEAEPQLPNESIKEVIRNGYEFSMGNGKQPQLLREAMVIIVNN